MAMDGNLMAALTSPLSSISGKIVLVDRGECNFSLKISKISEGGGLAGIVGLVASGDPFTAGDGGDRPVNVPGFMISQADADDIRAAGANTIATLDPNNRRSLALTMAPSSSRGPQHEDTSLIKPEIWERQEHVAPVAFKIFLDINQDGTDDYLIVNNDISGQPVAVDGSQGLSRFKPRQD